jgi:uncharacterized protein
LWDKYSEDKAPRADIVRIARIAIFAAIGVIIFGIVGNQSVNLLMNVAEFGDVFTKPFYYSILSGIILASIALVRVNFRSRHSLIWYGIRILINLLKRGDYESPSKTTRYSEFQMSEVSFGLWQLTKVLLFAPLFGNITFGMATEYLLHGNDLGLNQIGSIFAIPFAEVPMDGSYARQNLMPMIPALTLLIPPLLAAIGVRLILYVGVSSTVNVVSQYAIDSRDSKPKFLSYISTMEIIAGVTIFWIGFNMFFSSGIDYNTRYAIAGAITLGAALMVYGFIDKRHSRVIIYPDKRRMYARLFTAAVIVGLAGSIMIVNSSIADTRKELNNPYIAQQIEVIRHLHGLDQIEIVNYNLAQPSISPSEIQSIVDQNRDLLNNVRLWDEKNAKEKLEQQLSQRSDLQFYDYDLLRFGSSMYWTGTTVPVIPDGVAPKDKWFNQHIVYTHSDIGIKMLDAYTGSVVDESQFFNQRRIYYGESGEGLFSTYWSAYPANRQTQVELGGYTYNGTGGADLSPPLSWMFELNFMLSDPGVPVHVMRYKDIHDRMELLYPYFVYEFGFGSTPTNPQLKEIEAFAVTDGMDTYWLMPLVVAVNTSNVPWSSSAPSSFMLQLVGYSLIDTYNGTVQVLVTGNDYFSEMFLKQYEGMGATRQVPVWLAGQIRYPEEMFIWQVSKFNTYHVTDPKAYLEAKDYAVSDDPANEGHLPTYVIAKPPGFDTPEFVGLQSLKQKTSQSGNLAGYIAVQNDLGDLGKMTFFSLSANSPAKMIDAVGAQKALKEDSDYNNVKEAKFANPNANPPLGESTLCKFGNYEVYFIPIFTSTGGKQLGTVGAVGAASATNTHYVGFGDTPVQAFENYLQKLSGAVPPGAPPAGNQTARDMQARIQNLEKVFTDAGWTLIKPTFVSAPLGFKEAEATYKVNSDKVEAEAAIQGFIEKSLHEGERIFEWQDVRAVNFGVVREVNGIAESHYISIEVG